MDPRKEFIKQLRRYQKGSISRRHFLGVTGLGTAMAVMASAVPSLRPRPAYAAGSIGDKVETTTIDGRPAIHKTLGITGGTTYYVANAGRMYAIGLTIGMNPNDPSPSLDTSAALDAIARSLTFVTPRYTIRGLVRSVTVGNASFTERR